MKTVKAKIKGTSAILEGCICDDSFFVSVDHDTFERYDLDEIELCEPNPNSLTLEEAAEISFDEAYALTEDYRDFLAKGLTESRPRPIGPHWFCEYAKNRFIAGANWQKEKDTRDMVMSDNRQFQKVYELGKKDMMEKMMKEKINGIIEYINGKEEN